MSAQAAAKAGRQLLPDTKFHARRSLASSTSERVSAGSSRITEAAVPDARADVQFGRRWRGWKSLGKLSVVWRQPCSGEERGLVSTPGGIGFGVLIAERVRGTRLQRRLVDREGALRSLALSHGCRCSAAAGV